MIFRKGWVWYVFNSLPIFQHISWHILGTRYVFVERMNKCIILRVILRRETMDFSISIPASVNNLNATGNINDSNILAKHFNMDNILFPQVTFVSRDYYQQFMNVENEQPEIS